MRQFVSAVLLSSAFVVPAAAGFDRWSIEKERDPFSGGEKITANNMSSLRSGMFVMCDTADSGLTVRAIAGWDATPAIVGKVAVSALAVDGDVLIENIFSIGGAYGANIAGVDAIISGVDVEKFLTAMIEAQRQIAFQDGISNGPMLLSARGSTASGRALKACIEKQSK